MSKDLYCHVLIVIYPAKLTSDERDASAVNSVEPDEILDMRWVHPNDLTEDQVNPIYWPFISSLRYEKS